MSITANEFILKNTEGTEYVHFSGNNSNKPTASIGGWSIDYRSISKTYLTEAKDREYYTGMYSVWPSSHKHTIAGHESDNWRFVVGSRLTSDLSDNIAEDPTIPYLEGGYGFKFGVTREGYLCAENAHISGDLTITSGSIHIGEQFEVDENGNLYAKNARIGGTLEAGDGSSIGNWEIKKVGQYICFYNKQSFAYEGYEVVLSPKGVCARGTASNASDWRGISWTSILNSLNGAKITPEDFNTLG